MPHETSPSDELPPFMASHNVQTGVDDAEKGAVGAKFDSLVSDTLLNYVAPVRHLHGKDKLSLRRPIEGQPDAFWEVSIWTKAAGEAPRDNLESAEEVTAEIGIQKVVGMLGREDFTYRRGSDGVIRRVDHGDQFAMKSKDSAQGRGILLVNRLELFTKEGTQAVLDDIDSNLANIESNSRPNLRLEREMGLNDQPIGITEMEKLDEFMRQSGFEAG